jgi:two-component system, sensor histidine kinase and response regulator
MDLTPNTPIRVLVIDDDEDDFIIVKKIFGQVPGTPFDVEWCSSYDAALVRINERVHDAYLIDYRLGAHTGLDLLKKVEPEKRAEPFLLLTGVGDRDIELRSMRLAAADYLVKGAFDAHSLSRTIMYAIQRKLLEQQRFDHLIELNRSKDEFISIASHQLRTPATGVKQYIGMLLEGMIGELTPRQQDILQKAYDSNERQLRIVSDLLKVAQVDAGKVRIRKTTENLTALIRDIIREQSSNFDRRHQTVTFEEPARDIVVEYDKDNIRMVLENIVDNASKYSLDGTAINVTLHDTGEVVEVAVRDHGVGIGPDDIARLFEKFSRIDNPLSTKVGGTGLGLYWAKKIIDLHKGDITCQSELNIGTTFTVRLPKKGKM